MSQISVSLFCHDEGQMIKNAWNSILSNIIECNKFITNFEFEINIVVDSGDFETYNTIRNLKKFKYNLIEVTTNDLGINRNIAVNKSKYEMIAFIDADDIWGKSWVSRAMHMSNKKRDKNIIYHPESIIYFGNEAEFFIQKSNSIIHALDIRSANIWTSSIICSRAILEVFPYKSKQNIEYFDYEDWEWNRRTLESSIDHKVVPDTVHFVRKRLNSLSNRVKNE
jgi:hypothetical protein